MGDCRRHSQRRGHRSFDRLFALCGSLWQYSISPNAVVSVISAFAKACMLVPVSSCLGQLKWNQSRQKSPKSLYQFQVLDDASRGPWGSLFVFWKIGSPVAIMGAALTIFSVTLDPFAQQVLSFPSRDVVMHNTTAYIQRIENYATIWTAHDEFETVNVLDPTLQTALLTGLAQVNTPLEPICLSAHCDYPDITTLGICSSCEDATDTATQICRPMTFKKIDSLQSPLNESDIVHSVHANCSYTSPSGLILTPDLDLREVDTSRLEVQHTFFSSVASNDRITIGSIFMARYDSGTVYTLNNVTDPEKRPQMTECSMFLCEREYTHNNFSSTDRTLKLSRSQTLVPKNPDAYENPHMLIPRDNSVTFSANANYTIDLDTLRTLNDITSIFNTTIAQAEGSKDTGVRLGPILYHSNNISESFLSMATSMTDNIRSSNGAIHVPGRAFQSETYIHVRWPWIALPVTLIVLSILLLSVIVIISRGQSVLWKSSILPLIMGRLETSHEHEIAQVRHMDELQSISKKIKVVVKEEDQPLVFKEQ